MITQQELHQIQQETGLDRAAAELLATERRVAERAIELERLRAANDRAPGPEWARVGLSGRFRTFSATPRSPTRPAPPHRPDAGNGCPQCDGAGFYKSPVPYGHADFGKLFACACKEQERAERAATVLAALDDQLLKYRTCQLDTFELSRDLEPDLAWGGRVYSVEQQRASLRAAHQAATAYAQQPQGWLYLYGPCGSGKTRLAASIANARRAVGQQASYTTLADMFDWLRAGMGEGADPPLHRRMQSLERVPLLVLDDIDQADFNSWTAARFEQLVNERYNRQLPTILSSNDPRDTLPVRAADRIAGEARTVWVVASSYRRLKAQGG